MDDLLWMGPALIAGVAATRFGLPPMVGYLLCGFVLNASGVVDHDRLTMLGDLGVTLLLFTIGLKLDLRSLLKPVVWAGTTLHMAIVTAVFGAIVYWGGLAGLPSFAGLDTRSAVLIGFALSFSSTVFAVKTLEDKGEYRSKYGLVAIGVLIMQDIVAVVFLAASTGTLPSVWSLGLLALLVPARFALMGLLHRAGHSGELQVLYGIALAFGAYALFEAVDLKGDLGALIVGAMLASHPLAGEVSARLLSLKDLLLVGFFLSIGMSGNLSIPVLLIALLLTGLAAFKVALFFLLFTRFRVRARTATLSSLALANYSEFGLIVGSVALANGWLTEDWLVTIALSLTMTIVIAAPINMRSQRIFERRRPTLTSFETASVLPEDEPPEIGDARVVVVGMGRLGTVAYDRLAPHLGRALIGFDADPEVVTAHQEAGRSVVLFDATDDDLWDMTADTHLEAGILTLGAHQENLGVLTHLRGGNTNARAFVVARHEDEVAELLHAGAEAAWNIKAHAGIGLASEVLTRLGGEAP